MEELPRIWMVAANVWNNQSWTADKGWSSSLGVGEVLTTPHLKSGFVTKYEHLPRIWTDTLVQSKQRKKDARFSTWNVRSLYRTDSLTAAARK